MTVALITGSSRGIGRAIALKLASDGLDVVVNYHTNAAAAAEVVEEIETAGGKALAVQADIADTTEMRDLFQATEDHFGGLDVFVGNAATASFSLIADTSDEAFDLMWRTNTLATLAGLRESARRMRDGGRIVIVSSVVALSGHPTMGPYAASKAAGDTLVRAAAKELGSRGITVNTVMPGAVRTDGLIADPDEIAGLTPLGRVGEPEDIANVVSFLVSPSGGWITGDVLRATGGLLP